MSIILPCQLGCIFKNLYASNTHIKWLCCASFDLFCYNCLYRMDPSTPKFVFYNAEHNAINDDDLFVDMFLFLLEIKDTYDEAAKVERIPQCTSGLQGAAFVQ
jgi:hypothetical protein